MSRECSGLLEMCPVGHMLTELCQALASAGGYNKMLGTQTVLGESASQGVKVPRLGFHRGWRLN